MIGIHVNWELKFLIENRIKVDEDDTNVEIEVYTEKTTVSWLVLLIKTNVMLLPVKILFISHQSYQSIMSKKKITVESIINDDQVNRFFSTSFSLITSFKSHSFKE